MFCAVFLVGLLVVARGSLDAGGEQRRQQRHDIPVLIVGKLPERAHRPRYLGMTGRITGPIQQKETRFELART